MKIKLVILFLLFCSQLNAQDFKFHGKARKAIVNQFNLGEDDPFASEEETKKVAIEFDGRQLTIGKDVFKYIWHQNSRDMEVIQLNCIQRVEEGKYPYVDAKFEVQFKDADHVEITRFISTSPTTEKQVKYFVDVERTSK